MKSYGLAPFGGFARMLFDWDWTNAETNFQRALELSPRSPLALDAHANFPLFARGRLDEAIAVLNRALALDPLSPALRNEPRFQALLKKVENGG